MTAAPKNNGVALVKTPAARAAERADTFEAYAAEAQRREEAKEVQAISVGHLLDAYQDRLENGVERIPTGINRLDSALGGGIEVPSFTVLGAPPKAFKSSLSQKVAEKWIAQGGAVWYLDLENGPTRFLRRVLCRKAQLGASAVAQALRDGRAGAFRSKDEVARWNAAKAWLRAELAPYLFLDTRAPADVIGRLDAVQRAAGDRRLLAVVDSLQKLPGNLEERRATIDSWVRLFEKVRHELGVTFWVVSEVRRGKDGYAAREDTYKESGGIEYAADLALTLSRPAADEDEEPIAALRVELCRESDDDPQGDVASFRAVRPWYDLEEMEPVKRAGRTRGKVKAARDFLRETLAGGYVATADLLSRCGKAGYSKATVYRALELVGAVRGTLDLKPAWGLP